MTKKLESLFNLPPTSESDPTVEESKEFIEKNRDVILDIDDAIGDEVMRGTVASDALSLIVSGLEILSQRHTKFIFATHFHELSNFDEI